MKRIKKLLRKNWLTKIILTVAFLVGLGAFVFWMEGKTLAPFVIWNKFTHPHEIDFVNDISAHWWEALITLSLTLNIVFFYCVYWFFNNLNNGTLRWGGKSGND